MAVPEHQLQWTQPGWLDEAHAWIRAELERRDIRITGSIEQPHVRPWSTVLRVPTDEGPLFFKATMPAFAHEAALTQTLAGLRPDCMPAVLAIDSDRGWLLMRDLGVTLRSLIHSKGDLQHWQTVLPLYAGVQIEMVGRLPELLALGVFDRRLAVLPDHYADLLEETDALLIDHPDGLTTDEYRRLRELTPRVATMCQALADYGVPETLHHEDFHDANVFVRDGRYILSDWAETSVTHPFCTLLVTLRSVRFRLGLAGDDPALWQLRDGYLDAWSTYAPSRHLLAAFRLAYRLGMICRALTWHHATAPLPEAVSAEYAAAVPGWLQEFLTVVES